jgi:hypothetical protein
MKSAIFRIGVVALVFPLAIVTSGCAPYIFRYEHLKFEAQDGLEVLERSTSSNDSQGKELTLPKSGLPLKLRLARPNYTIHFDTPLSSMPLVFFSARDLQGVPLQVAGPSVKHVAPGSALELDGYEWSFYVKEADDAPLEFTITDAAGNALGTEKFRYQIVSRGYSYGIESI